MPLIPAAGDRPEYYLISYDKDGRERRENDGTLLSQLIVDILGDRAQAFTDVFVMSHGWKGDIPAAREQYDKWSTAMALCAADRERARVKWPDFKALLIGFHWPSQPWGEEQLADGSFAAEAVGGEEQFVNLWSDRIADSDAARDALRTLFKEAQNDIEPDVLPTAVVEAYRTLEREAGLGALGVAGPPDADREPLDPQMAYEGWRDLDDAVAFSGGLMGGLLSPLRQVSFWTMKKRARLVGEKGGHQLLQRIRQVRAGALRLHLMGHSFGCIVTSGMLRGEAGSGLTVSSVFLVQGAMSLWSYASQLPGTHELGYFRPVVDQQCVRGALVVTTSKHDRAVGWLYPKAAGVFRQVAFGTETPVAELPKYGALGAFGVQGAGLPLESRMIAGNLSENYNFVPGRIFNVNANSVIKTGGGLSGAHSDIAHPEVGHVFWEAVLSTPNT